MLMWPLLSSHIVFAEFRVQSKQSTVMLRGHPNVQGITVVLVGAEMNPELVFVPGVKAAKALLPPLPQACQVAAEVDVLVGQ
jgi:hypothetical protein